MPESNIFDVAETPKSSNIFDVAPSDAVSPAASQPEWQKSGYGFDVKPAVTPDTNKPTVQSREGYLWYGPPQGNPDPKGGWFNAQGQPVQPQTETGAAIQKGWQYARPFVAPVLETVPMIAGGIIGAGGGTILEPGGGTVAGGAFGAGLGHGIGMGLLKAADVYLGGNAPGTIGEQATGAATDVATGAALELGPKVAIQGIKAGAETVPGEWIVKNILNPGMAKASRIANQVIPSSETRQAVINALKQWRPGETPAQTIARTVEGDQPALQALLQRGAQRTPAAVSTTADIAAQQEAKSLKNLAEASGGATATEARGTAEEMKQVLNQETTPMREAALNRANLGKEVADLEAQSASLDASARDKVAEVRKLVNLGNLAEARAQLDLIHQGMPTAASKYTYKGELSKMADGWANRAANQSLELGTDARRAQAAATELRDAGINPLNGNDLIDKITGRINPSSHPEFAGNKELKGAVKFLVDEIGNYTKSNGVIDAAAVDALRKNAINNFLNTLPADPEIRKKAAAKIAGELKPFLDDAIESAGGRGWRDYLQTYSRWSKEIDATKLAAEAQKLWKTNKEGFIKLVQGESPDVVEKIMGPGNYDIAKNMAQDHLGMLRSEAQNVVTNMKVADQASAGQTALRGVLENNAGWFRLPRMLNVKTALANDALAELEGRIGKSAMDKITEASLSPEKLKDLLLFLDKGQKVKTMSILNNPSSWGPKGRALSAALGLSTSPTNQENK